MGGGLRSKKVSVKNSKAKDISINPVEMPRTDITKSQNYNASITKRNDKHFIKPYNQLELEMIVRENIYASACVNDRIQATVGNGYTDKTPDEVKKMFKKEVNERLIYDHTVSGEFYNEVRILSNKLTSSQHVPASTMTVANDRTKYYQYAGNPLYEREIPIFDEDKFNAGVLPDGNYIIHRMKFMGNPVYGIPAWIAAYDTLKIMDNAEKDILNYYDNDAIAKTIMMFYGITDPDNKLGAELKEFLEKNFQGAKKNNKLWLMTGLPAKFQGKEIDFKELSKNIVDKNYLDMTKENKQDVCVAFSYPIELLGVRSSGQLGNSQELKILLYMLNEYSIKPVQETITDINKIFYPEAEEIELKVMEIPEFASEEIVEEIQAKAKADFFETFNKLLYMMAEKEET
jgi:hypothetical protein